jgi:hypothetical protein
VAAQARIEAAEKVHMFFSAPEDDIAQRSLRRKSYRERFVAGGCLGIT